MSINFTAQEWVVVHDFVAKCSTNGYPESKNQVVICERIREHITELQKVKDPQKSEEEEETKEK